MTYPEIAAKLSKLQEMAQAAHDRAIYSAEESKRLHDQIKSVLDMLDATIGQYDHSEPLEQIKPAKNCTHPHWQEEHHAQLIIKTCATCGAEKYE